MYGILIVRSEMKSSEGIVFEACLLTKSAEDVNERREDVETCQNLSDTENVDDQAAPRILLGDQSSTEVRRRLSICTIFENTYIIRVIHVSLTD